MDYTIGMAVIVNGSVVAWFSDWTEEAMNWCTENYFGKWVAYQAISPKIISPTEEEMKKVSKVVEDMMKMFKSS